VLLSSAERWGPCSHILTYFAGLNLSIGGLTRETKTSSDKCGTLREFLCTYIIHWAETPLTVTTAHWKWIKNGPNIHYGKRDWVWWLIEISKVCQHSESQCWTEYIIFEGVPHPPPREPQQLKATSQDTNNQPSKAVLGEFLCQIDDEHQKQLYLPIYFPCYQSKLEEIYPYPRE